MRITQVEVHLVNVAAQPVFAWRKGLPGSEPRTTGAWLRVVTEDGLEGVAFCKRGVIFKDLFERRLREELIGQDALKREYLWQRLWEIDRIEELPIYVLGVIDVALWDLAAKAAGLPLHRLIGQYRDAIPAYASTATFNTTDEFLECASECLRLGYSAIKLHAWGDAKRDAQLCLDLRSHVGTDIPLMYDGSAGFDLPDAIYLGRALEEADYLWYEEPMREFSIHAYGQLARNVRVPLLVAETSDGAHMNVADFILSGCATFVRTSASFKGGVTGALRVAHLAESFGLRAEVHGGDLLHAHLCMSIPNTTHYESFVHTIPVTREARVDASGLVHAPTAPGVGFEAEWDEAPWLTTATRR